MAVYRRDVDGSIHRIITDAGKPNGVCVSPDQKTLYVVSNDNGATGFERLGKASSAQTDKVDVPLRKGQMALLAYDLSADGTAKFRKTLVDYAPFDGILVAAAADRIPSALKSQLSPNGGRLVIPVGGEYWQELMLIERHGSRFRSANKGEVRFVPLIEGR